ncbi:Gfo/Idh/MocA family protein [Vagococcus xieshaowenii]|uniref:Gfo/Idh/MocA family oxidoreductase n=1 Tax=Vagococcus xieshaowenii TaxID=2562451 RepID=A0AAJ5EGY0_9ENTE|nr:Gfo/Idh/MocA family oxidoreductase [Vagococcus xieshaowenii]QCA28857.1 Gfo/Idh/MocA family oxidoreductase [Vagococcus xieshaowenii]TFZ43436.1 Gfo/Idh/MocA family oxidoreductase [Vagococcus xieshaowenii]
MKKVNYGIVSTATIVPRFVEGVRQSEHGEVVAIAGRSIQKAKEFSEELSIPNYYGSYSEIMDDPEVDVIYIANYNGGHYEVAKEALNKRKNVLCEKPICSHPEEVIELFDLAEKNNVFLMEAQKSVFLPVHQYVKELIDDQVLGNIQWVNIISCHTGAKRGEWFKSLDNGGGILNGAGTYALEFILSTFGEAFTDIKGVMTIKPPISDDGVVINGRIGEQTMVSILISKDIVVDSRIEIYGEKGKITIPNFWKSDNCQVELYDKETINKKFPMKSEFLFEINHVNECLLQNKQTSPIMTPAISIKASQIVNAIYKEQLPKFIEKEDRSV